MRSIVQMLPTLRAHARVLTGLEGALADAVVEESLETAIGHTERFPANHAEVEKWLFGLVALAAEAKMRNSEGIGEPGMGSNHPT